MSDKHATLISQIASLIFSTSFLPIHVNTNKMTGYGVFIGGIPTTDIYSSIHECNNRFSSLVRQGLPSL